MILVAFIYFLKSNFLRLKGKCVVYELLVGEDSLLEATFKMRHFTHTFFDSADFLLHTQNPCLNKMCLLMVWGVSSVATAFMMNFFIVEFSMPIYVQDSHPFQFR